MHANTHHAWVCLHALRHHACVCLFAWRMHCGVWMWTQHLQSGHQTTPPLLFCTAVVCMIGSVCRRDALQCLAKVLHGICTTVSGSSFAWDVHYSVWMRFCMRLQQQLSRYATTLGVSSLMKCQQTTSTTLESDNSASIALHCCRVHGGPGTS